VTAHPTAEWAVQQFREALPGGHAYQYLIHDRDSIFSKELDKEVTAMGVQVLRIPVRAPKANSLCERFGGTLRRECLDFVIPFNERHLKSVLKAWIAHYHHSRPHMSLGPGIPAALRTPPPESADRHRIPAGHAVRRAAFLGGLHHEYWLGKVAA
jgi:transposase InsO family protein